MPEKQQGTFKKKKISFTQVQNSLVNDRNLSWKAKGIYLAIQSRITDPVNTYTKDYFLNMSSDGSKAFESGWKELKEAGWLKVHMYPNGKNGKFTVEYELLDESDPGPHTIYYDKNGNRKSDNESRNKGGFHEQLSNQSDHLPQNGIDGNGVHANGVYANGVDKNNTDQNTDSHITDLSINSSNDETYNDGQTDSVKTETVNYRSVIKNQIGYENLTRYQEILDKKFEEGKLSLEGFNEASINLHELDRLTELITDTMYLPDDKLLSINGTHIPASRVKEKFTRLSSREIRDILDKLKYNPPDMKNPRNYKLAMLFNSLS